MSQPIIISVRDPNIAYLLQRYAEESGHPVTHVPHSAEISALALALEPALVILAMDLPEAMIWQVVRELKTAATTAKIPIVIYSYLGEQPEKWREGVDGFLLKSVMYDDFVAMLECAGIKQPLGKTCSTTATLPTPATMSIPAKHPIEQAAGSSNGVDKEEESVD